MNFENLTPFSALTYDVFDASDEECPVIVARGTFDLSPALPSAGRAAADSPVTLLAEAAKEQGGLVVSDEHFGERNRSSVKQESDLAPGKPRCDVVVVGSAHSPTGAPTPRVDVAIRIRRTTAIPPFADVHTCLDHRLAVHGPRAFVRRSALLGGGWRLTDPDPFMSQTLRYEHAFGGDLRVYAQDAQAQRVRDRHRLSEEARARHPEGEGAPLAHTACPYNPLGVGWLEEWYADAASIDRWPAPQIEAPAALLTPEIFDRTVRGDAHSGDIPELTPRGVGVIARSWQPRLTRAGTLDVDWLARRWPLMPGDFDLAYWNGAHPDMQCELLFGGELVELWNLLPRDAPGVMAGVNGPTLCRFRLPEPVVAAQLKQGDKEVWGIPLIDTLIVDLDERRLSMVWRLGIPASACIHSASLVTLGDRAAAA